MANIGGSMHMIDRWQMHMMMSITNSIRLYGGKFWPEALKVGCRMRILSSLQRIAAVIMASAYRTVSKSAGEKQMWTTPESEPYNTSKRNGTLGRVVDGRQNFSQVLPAG